MTTTKFLVAFALLVSVLAAPVPKNGASAASEGSVPVQLRPVVSHPGQQSREPGTIITFGRGNGQHTRSRGTHSHSASAAASSVHLTSAKTTAISTPAPTATEPAALEDEAASLVGAVIKLAAREESATSVLAIISAGFAAANALGSVASKNFAADFAAAATATA